MATRVTLSNLSVNAMVEARGKLCDGGFLEIYAGDRPAGADDPVPDAARLLATLQLGTPAFKAPIGGSATANPMNRELNAPSTGRPAWYRLYTADHQSVIEDGTVGQEGTNLIVPTGVIQEHAEIEVRGFVMAQPKVEP